MSETAGKRRHVVPKMMIHRFAGDDGKLVELVKPELRIGTRRRSPSGILYIDDYYRSASGDFDVFLSTVERRFADAYPALADGDVSLMPRDSQTGNALLDWIAALECRTPAFARQAEAVIRLSNDRSRRSVIGQAFFKTAPDAMINLLRQRQFEATWTLLSRPGWRWKVRDFPEQTNLVITDNPLVIRRFEGAIGLIVIAPLSRRRVLFAGLPDDVSLCEDWDDWYVNFIMAGCAERHIFAATRDVLERLTLELTNRGAIECPEMSERARKPQFGFVDRIVPRSEPAEAQLEDLDQTITKLYGPSLMRPDRPRAWYV